MTLTVRLYIQTLLHSYGCKSQINLFFCFFAPDSPRSHASWCISDSRTHIYLKKLPARGNTMEEAQVVASCIACASDWAPCCPDRRSNKRTNKWASPLFNQSMNECRTDERTKERRTYRSGPTGRQGVTDRRACNHGR